MAGLPETVTIPAETLIESLAEILGVEELMVCLTGDTSTVTDTLAEAAARLLTVVAPHAKYDGEYYDSRSPITVEARARAHEKTAELLRVREPWATAGHHSLLAREIRLCGHAFGPGALADEQRDEIVLSGRASADDEA